MRMDNDKVTIETTIINYNDMLNQVQLVAELKKENLALLRELANADNILYDIAKDIKGDTVERIFHIGPSKDQALFQCKKYMHKLQFKTR